MSRAFVVRYEMRPETADENERLVSQVFDELDKEKPAGLCYASFRLADGVTFVHVGVMEDDDNALARSAAFQEFQRGFGDRAAGRPTASDATLVGSFGFPHEQRTHEEE